MNYRCLNFRCIWRTEGDIFEKFNYEESICFSQLFKLLGYDNDEKIHQTYYLKVVSDPRYLKSTKYSNYCLLGEGTIKRYLRSIKLIIPSLKWKVSKSLHNYYKCFDITLDITESSLFHKYLLTVTRYLWEFPRSVILRDAYLLKDMPEFKFDSIQNLFNLGVMTMFNDNYGVGHGLSIYPKYCSNKKLRQRLVEETGGLNNIYKFYEGKVPGSNYIEGDRKDNSFWISDEGFKIRLEKYKEIYKEWKKKSM